MNRKSIKRRNYAEDSSKHFQKTLQDIQESYVSERKPNFHLLAFVAVLGLAVFASWTRYQLPPLSENFNTARTLKHLENITRSYHPWGSAYNIEVGKYIVDNLAKYKTLSKDYDFDIQVQDEQMVSEGNEEFYKESDIVIIGEPMRRSKRLIPTRLYLEPRNILVRVKPKNSSNKLALLVTGHIDSAVASHGAFDDGIAVATMLELIESFTAENITMNADLIFLFGNGEELGLLDAHAFMSHSYRNTTVAFLNMEAGGNGHKAMLFRFEDIRLKKIYKSVPYPHLDVTGSDLFKLGLIPSDTNFRVFAKSPTSFGKMAGVDVAFYEGRYKYHTPKDAIDDVNPHSVQHLGENVQWFIKELLKSDYFKIRFQESNEVYEKNSNEFVLIFDVLGQFSLELSKIVYLALNILVVLGFIISIKYWSKLKLFQQVKELFGWILMTIVGVSVVSTLCEKLNGGFVGTFPVVVFAFIISYSFLMFLVCRNYFGKLDSFSNADVLLSRKIVLSLFYIPFCCFAIYACFKTIGALYLFTVWGTFTLAEVLITLTLTPNAKSGLGYKDFGLFLVRFAIPFILTWDSFEALYKGLAPSVLDGLSGYVVFGFLTLVSLIITIPLYPELYFIKDYNPPIKAVCVIVSILVIQMLFSFPYIPDKAVRIRPDFEADYSNGTVANVTASFGSGHDVEYTLKNWKNLNQSTNVWLSCGKEGLYSPGSKFTRPTTVYLDKCYMNFQINLFPYLKMEDFDMEVQKNDNEILAYFTAPQDVYSCEVIQDFEENFIGTWKTRIRSLGENWMQNNETAAELRYIRKNANNTWNFQIETIVEAKSNFNLAVEFRCFVDDLNTHVPFFGEFYKGLPKWATTLTLGERSTSMLKKIKI